MITVIPAFIGYHVVCVALIYGLLKKVRGLTDTVLTLLDDRIDERRRNVLRSAAPTRASVAHWKIPPFFPDLPYQRAAYIQ